MSSSSSDNASINSDVCLTFANHGFQNRSCDNDYNEPKDNDGMTHNVGDDDFSISESWDCSNTPTNVQSTFQSRGKPFLPYQRQSSESSSEEEVDTELQSDQAIRPIVVPPRGKELRLAKSLLCAENLSSNGQPLLRKGLAKSRTQVERSIRKSSADDRKESVNALLRKKVPHKKKGSTKKRKTPPVPALSESDSYSDDDVVAAVVVNDSDSEVDAVAIAEPVASNKKIKTNDGRPKKVKESRQKSPSGVKSGQFKAGKKTTLPNSIDECVGVPPEKLDAASDARHKLHASIVTLPHVINESNIIRSFGRIRPEHAISSLETLYSRPHAIYPIGFSCDRFEFSPIHGRIIKIRCDILDGNILSEHLKIKKDAHRKEYTELAVASTCVEEESRVEAQRDLNLEVVGDGPVFRVMWGEGIEEIDDSEVKCPFDPYASSGGELDAYAMPILTAKSDYSDIPTVGMRVSVRFDYSKLYHGHITKVTPNSKKSKTDKVVYNISIKYDDGVTEETTFPDPHVYLASPGCPPVEQERGFVTSLQGKPVNSVLGNTPLEAWGKALVTLGLIDEIIYEDALQVLHKSREDGMIEAREKIDAANKKRRDDRAKEKIRQSESTFGEEDTQTTNVDDISGPTAHWEDNRKSIDERLEPPSLLENELREKLTILMEVLTDAKTRSKTASIDLIQTRIFTISPFGANPFPHSSEAASQDISLMTAAVKKERARMGNTGNKRKVVTPATMMDKNDTFFSSEVERLIEGLPGSEFTPSYIFHANRSVSTANQAWVHEANIRHQKAMQKKLERERKLEEEAENKVKFEKEMDLKRKSKEKESANRKRMKEAEEEMKRKDRIDRRLSQFSLQMDDRLFKESYAVREKTIMNYVKGMNKEFLRRRKCVEMVVAHKLDQSPNTISNSSSSALGPYWERLPSLSRIYDEAAIRIWDFIHCFSDAIISDSSDSSLPTLDSLQDALDCLKVEQSTKMKHPDAIKILEDIAVSLCKVISPGLTRTLATSTCATEGNGSKIKGDGLDIASEFSHLPVTVWTWREIARMSFISDVLTDLGYSKSESANMIKGYRSGGHPNSKEAKRWKKIEDSPVAMLYQQLDHREGSCQYRRRFVTACLSVPSVPSSFPSDWRFFLHNIKATTQISATCLIENVEKSLIALKNSRTCIQDDEKACIVKLEKCLALFDDTSSEQSACSDLIKARQIALDVLHSMSQTSTPNGLMNSQQHVSFDSHGSETEPVRQKTGNLLNYRLSREQYRSLELAKEDYMVAALRLKEELDMKSKDDAVVLSDEDDEDDDSVLKRKSSSVIIDEEVVSLGSVDNEMVLSHNTPNASTGTKASSFETKADIVVVSDDMGVSHPLKKQKNALADTDVNASMKNTETPVMKSEHDFCDDIPTAPDLIRRCLAIVRTLCGSTSAEPFIYPVDPQLYPGYYESVTSPMSLYDVGNYLRRAAQNIVQGNEPEVEKTVAEFGRKVRRIVQNSLCYNTGNKEHLTMNSSEEILRIFERLFFDWVLAPTKPALEDLDDDRCIDHHDTDLTCMVLLCDGCEGKYNMSRLKPPLMNVPNGDWYCPRCVSGRCWTTVDPRLGRQVSRESLLGKVESCKFFLLEDGQPSIIYCIRFDHCKSKEYWGLKDVDKALIGEPVDPISCLQALAESPGYSFGPDSGVVSNALPLAMNPFVADNAAQAALFSSVFQDTVSACVSLMNPPEDINSSEWITLLLLLIAKCSSSDIIQELANQLESKAVQNLTSEVSTFGKGRGAKNIVPNITSADGNYHQQDDHINGLSQNDDICNSNMRLSISNKSSNCNETELRLEDSIESASNVKVPGQVNCEKLTGEIISFQDSIIGSEVITVEDVTSGSQVISTEEDFLRTKREAAFFSKAKREKKQEEVVMAFYIQNSLKSTLTSFEENLLSKLINNVLCCQENDITWESIHCDDLCSYCHLSDHALCSPLCRVPSEAEWSEIFPQAVHGQTSFMIAEMKRYHQEQNDSPSQRVECDVKLILVRVRVGGELVSTRLNTIDTHVNNYDERLQQFLPRNTVGFQNELKFRQEFNLSYLSGSLTAHEVCAMAAHKIRKDHFVKKQRHRHKAKLARDSSISCGKSIPIGVDQCGRSYWVFGAEPTSLFICDTNTATLNKSLQRKWHKFSEPEEIASIINCLGKNDPSESLKETYPEAQKLLRDKSWSTLLMRRSLAKHRKNDMEVIPQKFNVTKEEDEEYGPPFVEDEDVLVESENGRFLWDAVIVDIEKDPLKSNVTRYFVHFKNWSSRFDNWVPCHRVVEPSKNNLLVQMEALQEFRIKRHKVPAELKWMNASKFVNEKSRINLSPISISDINGCVFVHSKASHDERFLAFLKGAILLIEAALPIGSIYYWPSHAATLWRNFVKNAKGPESLLRCILLLEDAIVPECLHPQSSQLSSSLPKQWRAMSEASLPAIALRVAVLDRSVKYLKT